MGCSCKYEARHSASSRKVLACKNIIGVLVEREMGCMQKFT